MFALLRSVFLFALGWYAGVGLTVSVAGPAVFGAIESRTIAGDAFAAVLGATTTADVVFGGGLGVLAVLWLPRAVSGLRRTLLALVVAVLLAGIGYYTFGLLPAMREHRAHIATFDSPEVSVHRAAFDDLHVRYVRVYSGNLLLGLAAFVLAMGLTEARSVAHPAAAPRDALADA